MEPAAGTGAAEANNEKVAQVLQLVVQHVTDVKTAASMCQLSQGCRRAMQQSTGCLKVSFRVSANSLPAVTGFAAWLPKYPGLVQELVVNTSQPGSAADAAVLASEQLVSLALQLCAQQSTSAAPGAKPALRLTSFTTNFLLNTAALGSLAACRDPALLHLDRISKESLTADVCGALATLTSLTQLLCTLHTPATMPDCFYNVLARLPQLQDLVISGKMSHAGVAQLPSSLTELGLVVNDNIEGGSTLNLSHLSRLQKLVLLVPPPVTAQAQLPAALKALEVVGSVDVATGLQHVEELLVAHAHRCPQLLGRLPALPQLRKLTTGFQGASADDMEEVAAAIGAATQLTALQLSRKPPSSPQAGSFDCSSVRLAPHLGKLRALQQLSLAELKLGRRNALHFTSLAPLTTLHITACSIDDLAVAAMLQRQTALRELQVTNTALTTPTIWVAVACLTNLQSLVWRDNGLVLTADTLHLLSPLTALTSLVAEGVVGGGEGDDESDDDWDEQQSVSAAVEREFLARMPHLHRIEWV